MKDLRHPNIISLVDSFVEITMTEQVELKISTKDKSTSNSGYLHIIMDFAENGDLYQVILNSYIIYLLVDLVIEIKM